MLRTLITIFFILGSLQSFSQLLKPGNVAVKIQPDPNSRSSGFPIELEEVSKSTPLKTSSTARTQGSVLDDIFILEIRDEADASSTLLKLRTDPRVAYAEIIPQEQLFHVPNDPEANPSSGGQGHLEVVKAYEAWDITLGDENIVIGIIDTGMDVFHEDLVGNYFVNPNETEDGIDNDGNGYIDDIRGYDFADDDNDPHAETDINSTLNHGTHVGGIAGAETNNGIGLAGIGYNSKIAPLKGFTTNGTFSSGTWEGVLYAADNGYDIVNLSWGNTNGFSQFFQDIINYCVLENDMVVIAAAGNTNADLDFYPASYEHVISVGASTLSDTKWGSATFGDHVDIMAPGESILSTQKNDTYNRDSGSSHASPMVAGAAALVKDVFPEFNARQIMEQLRVTSDDIYDINPSHQYQLGKGRLNVFRAVSETSSRSIRVQNFSYDNGFGEFAFAGDTLDISFEITNFLAPVGSPTIGLESDSPYVTILSSNHEPGTMTTMETKQVDGFRLVLDPETPPETEIDLRFIMNEATYSDFQNVSFISGPDFLTLGNDNLSMIIGGDGAIAYLEPNHSRGGPITYNAEPAIYFSGLMIGTSTSDVKDNVINSFNASTRDDDFVVEEVISLSNREGIPLVGESKFSTLGSAYWIELSVIPGDEAYNILHYRVINTSGGQLTNNQFGFFADFELNDGLQNHAEWDAALNGLVFFDDQLTTYGILSILDQSIGYKALNIGEENGHTKDIGPLFSDADKYAFLAGDVISEAGELETGNDVAGLVNLDIGTMEVNEDSKAGVLLGFADTYEDLAVLVMNAQGKYDVFLSNPKLEESFQACGGEDFILNPTDGTSYAFYEDPEGNEPITTGESVVIPSLSKDTIFYASNLDGSYPSEIVQFKIQTVAEIASFELGVDTLYLDAPGFNAVQLIDQSVQPESWLWDFGNGSQATTQHPNALYDTPGTYNIVLQVESGLGCTDVISKQLLVANRPDAPILNDLTVCLNETIQLDHPTEQYSVYDGSGQRVLKSSSLLLGPFPSDSTMLIAQWVGGLESLPTEMNVALNPLQASYTMIPDTLSTATAALFSFDGIGADSYQWSVNGNSESTDDAFSLPITGSINLELIVSNDDCSDVLTETLNFIPSPTPTVSDLTVCSDESTIVQPGNGTYFGFYNDQGLSDLIRKGRQLSLDNIQTDRTIYVVGLDSILPGESSTMNITVSDFQSSITADPESLDLSTSFSVQLNANPEVVSAQWFVDDVLVDGSLNPILIFTEPGFYEIKLTGMDASGCQSTDVINYEVFEETAPLSATNEIQVEVYPNPSNGVIHLKSDQKIDRVRIIDMAGRVRLTLNDPGDRIKPNLAPGYYILDVNNGSIRMGIRIQ